VPFYDVYPRRITPPTVPGFVPVLKISQKRSEPPEMVAMIQKLVGMDADVCQECQWLACPAVAAAR